MLKDPIYTINLGNISFLLSSFSTPYSTLLLDVFFFYIKLSKYIFIIFIDLKFILNQTSCSRTHWMFNLNLFNYLSTFSKFL